MSGAAEALCRAEDASTRVRAPDAEHGAAETGAFLAVPPFLTFRMETFTLRYYILEVRRLGFVAAVVVVVLIL